MGLGKTYSADYLADSNNNTGASGQVLISTATGINWSDGTDIIGGPYLPLSGGTLTGTLVGTIGNFAGLGYFGEMVTIDITDISTGENRGLKLLNSSGTDQVWNITAGQTGVDNDKFTIRDSTNNVDALTIAVNGGTATFAGNGTFAGAVNASYFRTAAANTNYNLLTRDNTGNALFVQSAQSNANQPIANFRYGDAAVNAGTPVLQVSKDNSHFVNCNLGVGNASPTDARLKVLGNVILDSHSASDPDSTSRTAYPAGQMLTHYDEANGVSIIGGQGGFTGTGLTIGEETGRSSAFKFIRGVSDTNGGSNAAEEFWVDGLGNSYFAGYMGIGVAPGARKLDVAGVTRSSGFMNTDNYAEKILPTISFTNTVANENYDIQFGNISFWGYIEVEITGTYSNQNTSGKLTKIYAVGTNPATSSAAGIIYTNETRVSDSLGFIKDNIALGDFSFDGTDDTGTFAIRISHIVSTGNNYTVKVKVFTHGSNGSNGAAGIVTNLAMSAKYTATALSRQYVYYNDTVGFGTSTPDSAAGSVHINKSGTSGDQTIVATLGSTSLRPILQFSEGTGGGLSAGMSIEYNGVGTGILNHMAINSVSGAARMILTSGGALQLNSYTMTQQTGTSAYLLGVDASGNVVQSTNIPSGTGGSAGPYLPLGGGTITGSLSIVGDIRGNNPLILNVGESYAYATGQTGEILYVNSENGMEINSSPDNWASGWAGKNYAYINRADASSSLPGALTVNGNFTVNSNLAKLSGSSPFFDIVNSAETDAGIIFQDLQDSNQRQTIAFNSSDNALKFMRNNANTESMRIKSDGNVGINDTNPATKLSVGGTTLIRTSTGVSDLYLGNNSTAKYIRFHTNNTNTYFDMNCGVVYWRQGSGTRFQNNMTTGTFTASGDIIAYGSPSDIRLKENIKPIESALDKAMKLQGVTFDWKKSDSILDIKEDIGFIAQDVQKVVPELVRENSDGMLSMRHQGITPILLEAIKELKAEIEDLKKKIK